MTQLTPVDLVRILAQVTLILVVCMVGGTVLGLVLDIWLGTSPILVLSGLAVGSLAAAAGVWLYIRRQQRRLGVGSDDRADGQ